MSGEIQVPDSTIWGGIVTGFAAAFGWLMRLERWRGKVDDKIDGMREDLKDIKTMIAEDRQETRDHRDRVNNQLHSMGMKIAIIETRIGVRTSDTGTVRKL